MTEQKTYTFWMCWIEGTREPTYHHRTMAEAQKEAERLARIYAGKKVFILHADVYALIELPACIFSETSGVQPDELPF